MSFAAPFLLTPELQAELEKYKYSDDIVQLSDEEIAQVDPSDMPFDYEPGATLYRLKPDVAAELESTEQNFSDYKFAEDQLDNAKKNVEAYVRAVADDKAPQIVDQLGIEVTDRIGDRYVGDDAGALYVTLTLGDEEEEIEHGSLYYSGASESLGDSFSSWNWAFWLGSYNSPFKSDNFVEGYEYQQVCSALEQFAQTLDESDFRFDVEKALKRLSSVEPEAALARYPLVARLLR